ncbi:signal peptide prediction [Ramlibacter sp.]|uniref:signal peptide prediction n=1 Tax=Ramlibacter sp. TaxID=1917967 RepID=UPI001809A0C2|nr:signal peptide prediction [Ramlibacter sp.]MBA2674114.1 hypothetical protein [Ramlibacter sp.]
MLLLARMALALGRYLWAGPYSCVGLLLGGLAVLLGGTARVRSGVVEIAGGWLGRLLVRLPARLSFSAITLGHVILGTDHSTLLQMRRHEHVHVRQYEQWGPLYVPAYLLSSLVQLLRGRNPYRDNYFERQAYAQAPAHGHGRRTA